MALFRLDDKTVLITGASSGLGAHFAHLLATHGARVVLAARRLSALENEVAAINAAGGQARAVTMDVTDPASVKAAYDAAGPIDVLINNAGVAGDPKKFLDTGEDDWRFVVDTNLSGAWRVAREAAARWVATDRPGVIVNVASVYGLRTGLFKVGYNVSKAGIVQLTRTMSMELVRHGIRVNALCPGWFLTSINDAYFQSEAGIRYVKTMPMRRLGRIEELDGPLLLLASDAGSFMTGSEIVVDGGLKESSV
jgi:NAD(P)-dependent dehydrogenase (short-subunit alcohol dehydrogenase family)